MCNPVPQDYFGETRFDDKLIPDEGLVYRHCRAPVQVVPKADGGLKISDQEFKGKKTDAGVSVDLGCLLENAAVDPLSRFGVMPNTHAMLAVSVGDARTQSAGVAWTPKPEELEKPGAAGAANPYHGEILHPMTGGQARALYRTAVTVHSTLPAA